MSVLERYYCNLFIWTPIENGTVIARVITDDKFCKSTLQTTKQYFFDILLPKVVKRKFGVFAENKQQNYCVCKRQCFEPMIAFHCTIDWFHYACVQIRSMKFLFPEVALFLNKSTIRPCMEYCFHIWAGAPSCFLELLDKLQKRIYRTVGHSLATSLEPLAHC